MLASGGKNKGRRKWLPGNVGWQTWSWQLLGTSRLTCLCSTLQEQAVQLRFICGACGLRSLLRRRHQHPQAAGSDQQNRLRCRVMQLLQCKQMVSVPMTWRRSRRRKSGSHNARPTSWPWVGALVPIGSSCSRPQRHQPTRTSSLKTGGGSSRQTSRCPAAWASLTVTKITSCAPTARRGANVCTAAWNSSTCDCRRSSPTATKVAPRKPCVSRGGAWLQRCHSLCRHPAEQRVRVRCD